MVGTWIFSKKLLQENFHISKMLILRQDLFYFFIKIEMYHNDEKVNMLLVKKNARKIIFKQQQFYQIVTYKLHIIIHTVVKSYYFNLP